MKYSRCSGARHGPALLWFGRLGEDAGPLQRLAHRGPQRRPLGEDRRDVPGLQPVEPGAWVARVEQAGVEPQPVSGRQEYLENLINSYI